MGVVVEEVRVVAVDADLAPAEGVLAADRPGLREVVGDVDRRDVALLDELGGGPVLTDLIATTPALAGGGRTLIADKNYYGREFESTLAATGFTLLRKARTGENPRPGAQFFKPLRQTIESVFDTLKGQLSLERHGGRTPAGVIVRVLQRLLALTTAIWHNDHTSQPVLRSLTAYDH